ncbi:MAG: hypothetical protein IRZ08_07385 [Frankia sp.]|nr:hypothetical protein [Frankia sp.]
MAPGFDTVGLLAASPRLVAAAFAVLAPAGPAAAPPRPVRRLVLLTDLLARATDELAALARRSAASWADSLGLELVAEPLVPDGSPLPASLAPVFWPLMSREVWQSNGAWVEAARPVLGEGIEGRIRAAREVGDAEVAAASAARDALRARLAELLGAPADAVAVLPTTIDVAPPRTSTHAELLAWRDRCLPLVVPASLAGAPQLTLPAGRTAGAPAGVSLLGLPGDDEVLLALAERLA